MIALLIRLVLFAAVIAGVYLVVRWILQPTDGVMCSRCDGKGFWYGARGKETCDWCKGSGRLPRQAK
jgi:DnaJ-class molecular chaperone